MPAAGRFVLDANAVLALLLDEPGRDVALDLLNTLDHQCVIHALNSCEVFYDLLRRDNLEAAVTLVEALEGIGIQVIGTMDRRLWERAGRLKASLRRVSLADCIAMALTLETDATLVTTDHHELDRIAAEGVCPILFLR